MSLVMLLEANKAYKFALESIKKAERENPTLLELSRIGLESLPPEIGKLTNLMMLDLSDNRLTSLPPEIGNLKKLIMLDLDNNQITHLPKEIINLELEIYLLRPHLLYDAIFLTDNPLESPPIEVIEQGREAIKAYFEQIEKEETIQLFEAKLLLVGQGGVGKTYLMNRLIHNKIDPATVSTEGIYINQWIIKTKQTDRFRVNFWDFGGQEIYHATHQFFLTKRSLYLFVWESRTDADLLNFDYWLNTVKVLSDNSSVIVIQNKIDERKKSINQEGWKKRFPNIVEYHDVSATKPSNIDDLKDAIIREIGKLPHIGDLLPKRWIDIRKLLEGLNENFIPYSRYQEICDEFDMDDKQTSRLSEYYHDLGVFLFFKENPILRNTIFLKPEWATRAVYKVTDNQKVKDNFGKFHFSELADIWEDKKEFPVEKHVELVELMKSFELCFELPNGQEYIIPELLRANQPELGWDYTDNLRFKYVYDFMPAGIITRFIVITHDLVKADFYWKDGVILTWENNEALVIKTDNRIIEVWINGHDKKTLLGIIRRHINYIHSPFSNLKVNEMIPCNCSKCLKNPNPHFYSYQNLIVAQKKDVKEIQCQKGFKLVPIDKLFGEIHDKTLAKHGKKPQSIKIFLASSVELDAERQKLKQLFYDETKKYIHRNVFLDLVIWEDLKHSFQGRRAQEYFNKKMLECDIVICIFFKKVGDFTKEEFDLAYKHFKEGKKPHYLYVFFRSGKVDIEEIDEDILKIKKLKSEIEEAEQIYKSFKSNEDLLLQLKKQLELILPEMV